MEKGSRELSRVTPRSIEISPSEEFKRVLPIIVSLVTEVDDGYGCVLQSSLACFVIL